MIYTNTNNFINTILLLLELFLMIDDLTTLGYYCSVVVFRH